MLLIAEREVHAYYLNARSSCSATELSPACMAYTSYLIATAATASLEEAIAAVLPCFWIYREVGREVAKNSSKDNPYSLWINTYSNQEFSDVTDKALSILDEKAKKCSQNTLTLMEEAFKNSSLLEWHFWNDAYHMTLLKNLPIYTTL